MTEWTDRVTRLGARPVPSPTTATSLPGVGVHALTGVGTDSSPRLGAKRFSGSGGRFPPIGYPWNSLALAQKDIKEQLSTNYWAFGIRLSAGVDGCVWFALRLFYYFIWTYFLYIDVYLYTSILTWETNLFIFICFNYCAIFLIDWGLVWWIFENYYSWILLF